MTENTHSTNVDSDETGPSVRFSLRVDRAVKSTAALVADAEELLRQRRARPRAELELEVLRAAFRTQRGYAAAPSMKRKALIDALAVSFGIE